MSNNTDSTISFKKSPDGSWKIKTALGLGGLFVVLVTILAIMFRFEFGIIVLVTGIGTGLGLSAGTYLWFRRQYQISEFERRRLEAETRKVEAEAENAMLARHFVVTPSGSFHIENETEKIEVKKFYPAVPASREYGGELPPPDDDDPPAKKLLDVNFIHLLVTGPSDTGKTTCLCHLIDNSPLDTIVYVLDPHAKFNRWPNRVNEVIGYGRDYQAIDSKLVSLVSEMHKRYNSDKVNFQKVLIVADEWLGILEHCDNAPKFFNTIGSEARKVAMSLVVSSISMTVDDLDVSAAIRDNLAQLTLSRTLKSQNLGEIKWSRADKELVELPGPYRPPFQLPPTVAPVVEDEPEDEPFVELDPGPVAPTPTEDEQKVLDVYDSGTINLKAIYRAVYNSDSELGGRQTTLIRDILIKYGRISE